MNIEPLLGELAGEGELGLDSGGSNQEAKSSDYNPLLKKHTRNVFLRGQLMHRKKFNKTTMSMLIAICMVPQVIPAHVAADTLMFNASWGFDSPGNRSARANALDLELRKKGGFYDSFQTNILYDGNTFITYDCTGSNARATGTDSVTSSDARTSSPSTGSELAIDATSRGNESDIRSSNGHGSNATDQINEGEVRSDVNSSFTNTTGPLNASGGVTNQTSRTTQSNSGAVTATSEGGVGCNFFTHDQTAEKRPQP